MKAGVPRRIVPAALLLLSILSASPARAWIYPEHRAIAGKAVADMGPAEREALDALWAEARQGHEDRLCPVPWAADQGPKPTCIDWAAWPAISGDHSCSAGEMLGTVLESDWIVKVAGVCSRLEVAMATAKNPIDLRNRLVRSDLELARADKEYASRAGANNVHFLLARSSDDGLAYLKESARNGGELNALGTWIRAHVAALRLAAELGSGRVAPADRPALARTILALEAYGAHFLEDSFASGHVAGCWGDVATRKGTHDYYNEHGIDTRTWDGKPIVLYGDARMRTEDRDRAAPTIRASLSQVLAALQPGSDLARLAAEIPLSPAEGMAAFDTCKSTELPSVSRSPGGPPRAPGDDPPHHSGRRPRQGRLPAAIPFRGRSLHRPVERHPRRLGERRPRIRVERLPPDRHPRPLGQGRARPRGPSRRHGRRAGLPPGRRRLRGEAEELLRGMHVFGDRPVALSADARAQSASRPACGSPSGSSRETSSSPRRSSRSPRRTRSRRWRSSPGTAG